MKKPERVRKPTKTEQVIQTTIQAHRHMSTQEVITRRDALLKDVERFDAEVLRYQTGVAEAKENRARAQAAIDGLTVVVDRR